MGALLGKGMDTSFLLGRSRCEWFQAKGMRTVCERVRKMLFITRCYRYEPYARHIARIPAYAVIITKGK